MIQYIPRVFKQFTDEDYLRGAIETANWLKTLEIKTEHGKIWKNFPDGQNGFGRDIMLFGPTNIYSGSAGIGIFYLRLYEATGDEQYLEEAKAAADHIISVETDASWYEKTLTSDIGGVIPVPGWAIGYSNGPMGQALFLDDIYQVTKEEKYKAYVLKVADDLLEAGKYTEDGLHWSNEEDVVADGGFVFFLVQVYEHFVHAYEFTKDEEFLEYAKRTAKVLLSDSSVSDEAPDQRKWFGAWTRTIPDKVVSYAGLYVGSAGCASALLSLYAVDHRIKLTQLFEYAHFND